MIPVPHRDNLGLGAYPLVSLREAQGAACGFEGFPVDGGFGVVGVLGSGSGAAVTLKSVPTVAPVE